MEDDDFNENERQELNTERDFAQETVVNAEDAPLSAVTDSADAADREDTPNAKPLIEQIYDAVNDVIGGSNENQLFCMMMPGTALNAEDYEYDTQGKKPETVAANESRLVNKLFDACHVTGSDNGLSLPNQFLSALNVLTPKLNPELARAKTTLRKMLMTKIDYSYDDGQTVHLTFQQVFYKLYEDWVYEKRKWADAQTKARCEFTEKYGENKKEAENAYLEWYETNAESYLLEIEAKMGKILGLFSIEDMQIIEGVLNSGAGSELYEAKTAVLNAKKYDPDGGAVYPVTLTPSNWQTYLKSNFQPIDLLDTPDALMQRYRALTSRRLSLTNQITRFKDLDQGKSLKDKITALESAQSAYNTAATSATTTKCLGMEELVKTIAGFVSGNVTADKFIYEMEAEKVGKKSEAGNLKTLLETDANVLDAQTKFTDAAKNLAKAGMELIAAKAADLSEVIKPLITELNEINGEIDEIQAKVGAISKLTSEPTALTAKCAENGFTEVLIHTDASSTVNSTSMVSNAAEASCGAAFWFGGYSRSSSSSSSAFKDFSKSSDNKIEIGFHAAKVDINRAWFDPGVFLLSRDMFNISGKRISAAGSIKDDKALSAMKECLFPCFPAAFVIAKDVTIRISNTTDVSNVAREAIREQVSKGGGIFCFRASSASSSSSDNTGAKVQNTSNAVTIKFPGPQILGYYLEKTPTDESKFFVSDTAAEDISIEKFVMSCKQMMDNVFEK